MSADIVVPRLTAPVGPGNRARTLEIAQLFLRMGCTVFGGPAAHIAVMESEVVTRRAWMSRDEFLDHLGVVQLLPGPNSTEMAIHIGHVRGGWRGATVAGLGFVLPSVAMVWGLAMLTGATAVQPVADAVLWWMVPVVVAVLMQALWAFGKHSASRPHAVMILPAVAIVAMLASSDLLVLLSGALIAILVSNRLRAGTSFVLCAIGFGTAVAAGVLEAQTRVPASAASPDAVSILLYFLRAGVSVFGSGYVLVAYLQHDLVDGRGWLSTEALAQAAALAHVTPGPLFSMATAVGFSVGGHAGALAATVGVFAPAFLSVVISRPVRRLVQQSPAMRTALDGVVLASVALLGRALIGFAWPMRGWQWGVCGLAALVLLRMRAPASLLLLGTVAVGIVASLFHFIPS